MVFVFYTYLEHFSLIGDKGSKDFKNNELTLEKVTFLIEQLKNWGEYKETVKFLKEA